MMIAWTGVYFKREKRFFQKSLQRKIRPEAQGRDGTDKDHFVLFVTKTAQMTHKGYGKPERALQGLICVYCCD